MIFDQRNVKSILGEDVMNDVAVDISKAAVDAVLADGELLMIDAHEVKNGGVEVVASAYFFYIYLSYCINIQYLTKFATL